MFKKLNNTNVILYVVSTDEKQGIVRAYNLTSPTFKAKNYSISSLCTQWKASPYEILSAISKTSNKRQVYENCNRVGSGRLKIIEDATENLFKSYSPSV